MNKRNISISISDSFVGNMPACYSICRHVFSLMILFFIAAVSVANDDTDSSRPSIMIPLANKVPSIDGVLSAGEWDDAAELTGFIGCRRIIAAGGGGFISNICTGPVPQQTFIYFKYDRTNLYILTVSPFDRSGSSSVSAKAKEKSIDGNSVKFFLRPPSPAAVPFRVDTLGKRFELTGNLAGSFVDQMFNDRSWQSKAKYASRISGNKWIGEWAVPFTPMLKSSGLNSVGNQWRMNIFNRFADSSAYKTSEWTIAGSTANWRNWGYINFGKNNFVRLENISINKKNVLNLEAISIGGKADCIIRLSQSGMELSKSIISMSPDKSTTISFPIKISGELDLDISFKSPDGRVLMRSVIPAFEIKNQLNTDLLSDPFRGKLRISARPEIKIISSLNATVKDLDGKELGNIVLKSRKDNSGVLFSGELDIDLFGVDSGLTVTTVGYDVHGKKIATDTRFLRTFHRPEWLVKPVSADRISVLSPWRPLMIWENGKWLMGNGKYLDAVSGSVNTNPRFAGPDFSPPSINGDGNIVRAWGRDYDFGTEPFVLLKQVTSLGENILAGPLKLTIITEGSQDKWEKKSDEIKFDGIDVVRVTRVSMGNLVVTTVTRLEYDGFLWFEVKIDSPAKVTIKKLTVDLLLLPEVAELLSYRSNDPWPYNQKAGVNIPTAGSLELPFCISLNLTNDIRGIGWVNRSMKGWAPANWNRPMELAVSGKTSTLSTKIIEKDTTIDKTWKTDFGLQVYPLKPWQPEYSFLNYFGTVGYNWLDHPEMFKEYAAKGVEIVNYHESWQVLQDCGYPPDDAKIRKFVKMCHDAGMKVTLYAGFGHSTQTSWFEFYRWPWIGETISKEYYCRPYSDKTSRAYNVTKWPDAHWVDFQIAQIARWIDDYDIDGVFIDGFYASLWTDRPEYDLGFVGPDGKRSGQWIPLAARRYAERVYRTVKSRKPDGIITLHKGHTFMPYSGAFATNTTSGESLGCIMAGEKMSRVPEKYMRAVFGRQFGLPGDLWSATIVMLKVISQDALITSGYLYGVPVSVTDPSMLEAVRPFWSVSNTLRNSRFLPYWDKDRPLVISPLVPDVRVSCYVDGNEILAVVGNLSKKDVSVTLVSRDGEFQWENVATRQIYDKNATSITVKLKSEQNLMIRLTKTN